MEKLEGPLKRDSVFTDNTFGNMIMKKQNSKDAKGMFKIFPIFKMKGNNKALREC